MKKLKAKKIRLSDHRYLAYEEFGDPNGTPLIYLHGTYSSRYEGNLCDNEARKFGIRILCIDRPGYGQSTYNENQTIKSYANDIIEFADKIGLDTFFILGMSGGAPYACSVALQHKNRVNKLIIVSGVGDFTGWNIAPDFRFRIVRKTIEESPKVIEKTINGVLTIYYTVPKQLYNWHKLIGSKMDNEYKKGDQFKEHFFKYGEEAFVNGSRGALKDIILFSKKWDIDVENIDVDTRIWHGSDDKTVPVEHAITYHNIIRNNRLNIIKDGGHYVFFYNEEKIFNDFLNK